MHRVSSPQSLAQEVRRILALTAIPFAILIAFVAISGYHEAEREGERIVREQATRVTIDIERLLDAARIALQGAVHRPVVRALDPRACVNELNQVVATTRHFNSALLVDAGGRAICSTATPEGLPGEVNLSQRDWFIAAMQGEAFAIGAPVRSKVTGRRVFSVAMPVRDGFEERVVGVMTVAIELVGWQPPGGVAVMPEDSMVAVLSERGTVVFRFPEAEAWVGRSVADQPIWEAIGRVREGVFEGVGLLGFTRIWAVRPIPGTRWTAVAGVRKTTLLGAPLMRTGLLLLMQLAALGAAWLALHRVIRGRQASERNLRMLWRAVDQSPASIVITDDRGRIQYVNPCFETVTGYRAAEVLGENPRVLQSGLTPQETYRALWTTVRAGREWRGEFCNRRKNGEIFWEDAAISGIVGEDGAITHYVAVKTDVTERKMIHEARMRSQKLESLGTLAGGIAHDFNNLLMAIRGNADLAVALMGPANAASGPIEEIRRAGGRASELVRRITAFGRPKEARQVPVDLAAVCEEVLKLLRSTLPAGIELRTRFGRRVACVMADAAQVHEVLVNLTTNAAHAIGERGGLIDYVLETVILAPDDAARLDLAPGAYTRLSVRDDGHGMAPETQARIFDAFFTTKPPGEGSGLGLSMVYGIMDAHHGAVTVESEVGRGSSFQLYFPVAASLPEARPEPANAEAPPAAPARILYVDDEDALVLLAQRALSRRGHEVTGFTDPHAALAALHDRPGDFDIVVTDLSMPRMSGFEFAARARQVRPDLPVLMMTGYVREEDEARAREAGLAALLLKPSTVDELARVLDDVLRDVRARMVS